MNPHDQTLKLSAETQRLRVEFLDRELDLTDTLIQLVEAELNFGNDAHAHEGIEHISMGLKTIRKFLPLVASPNEIERISERLERLESKAAHIAE